MPDMLGTIEPIEPTLCRPHLDEWADDKILPKAMLISYVPECQTLAWSTCSKAAIADLRASLTEIHEAGVVHGDAQARNTLILPEGRGRSLWIDFDRSQTLHDPPTEREQDWLETENSSADYMFNALVSSPLMNYVSQADG